jgi:competence protein ComEA
MDKEKVKNSIIVLAIFLLGCTYILYSMYLKPLPDEWIEVQLNAQKKARTKLEIVVHVSGAVRSPGLYTYSSPKRVIDAIKEAGGLQLKANTDRVNLAKFIYDGQHIHVPFKKEKKTSRKRRSK